MEDSPDTINQFRRLKVEFPKNVGLVMQAYMRRTLQDLTRMLEYVFR